jgi:hypothetical protein
VSIQRAPVIDTLRLTQSQCAELLRESIEREARSGERHERAHRRFPFADVQSLVLRVDQPGGNAADYRVLARNISQGGLAVFHGQLLYPNTRCTAFLRTAEGKAVAVSGTVVYCRHYRAKIHEVGVRFDEPVDVTRFVGSNPAGAPAPEAPMQEVVVLSRELMALVQTNAARDQIKHVLSRIVGAAAAAAAQTSHN